MERLNRPGTGIRRPWKAVAALLLTCLLPVESALPQASVEIRVGAVVPPRLCLYPEACTATTTATAGFGLQAVIDGNDVYFYGARPQVDRSEEFLLVLF